MNYEKTLRDFQFTFDNYRELSVEGYDDEKASLQLFYDENYCEWEEEDEKLYWTVDNLAEDAGAYFDAIENNERMDYERDLRNDLASECNH